jgi:hypothetical protein
VKKPKLTDAKYRWTIVYHLVILNLIFVIFDYRDTGEWIFWDTSRTVFFLIAYILFAFIQYKWDVYVYNNPDKFPVAKIKYSRKTYAEHKAEREAKSKDA